MNKITKASIAAGAAVLLLMGGGGTLAYWNSSTSVGTGTIQSGNLAVAPVTPSNAVWKDASNATVNLGTFRAVPGDVLTFTQDVQISATGNNLIFTIGLSGSTFSGDAELVAELTKNATFTLTGSNLTSLGSGKYKVATAGNTTATISVTVTWPFNSTDTGNVAGLDNDAKNKSVTISDAVFTLTQVAS